MKYSIFTVMAPEFTPEKIVGELSRLGYNGVEWRVVTELKRTDAPVSFWENNRCTLSLQDLEERPDQIRQITEKNNLEVCNLATYLQVDEFSGIEKAMRAAKIMHCPRIRVNVPKYTGESEYNSLFHRTQQNLKKVEELASEHNIKALLELHMGNIIPSASAAYRLICPFNPEYIGVIYDPGNMVHEGYERWLMGMQLLGDYLAHVHVKNARWVIEKKDEDGTALWKPTWAPLKEGIVNWREIMDDLRAVDYSGYLSFEDFSHIPTEKKLVQDIEYLKEFNERG